jgi:SARP family transcriptional regulator, regulator of embCAB operon
MEQARPIRILLLGELHVTRRDASVVTIDEWRTNKTRDLLALLALGDGHPVRTAPLIESLWPDVEFARASNSLRTAASQIRSTLRENCVVRRPNGLLLTNVVVDVTQFRALAGQVRLAARREDSAEALAKARSAESLYRGDFHAYDDDHAWAVAERESLRQLRQQMLCEASVAALDLSLFREALDLATIAVRLDPASETAHRSLMRAHAELGEIGMALRVFEGYRAHLADELGVDPSPQTQDLHLSLLRGGCGGADKKNPGRGYPSAV